MPRPKPSARGSQRPTKAEAEASFLDIVSKTRADAKSSSRLGEVRLADDKREGKRRAAEIILKHGGGRKGPTRIT